MDESVVSAEEPVADAHGVSWTGSFTPPGDEPALTTFRFGSPTGAAPPMSARPFLLAFLPAAMRVGRPVLIDGPIDDGTLANLMEWQEAMAAWHPGELQVVSLRADGSPTPSAIAPDAGPAPRGAVSAFSGGADSSFTAVRHRPGASAEGPPDFRRTEVRAGLFVHGFDIDRADDDTFLSARERVIGMLEALEIMPLWLQTDIRDTEARFPVSWETATHGIWLAAALATVEAWYDLAVIPSTFSYHMLRLPWASNPITDPLLGSDRVAVWHDGAAFGKLPKVREIIGHPEVVRGLRVCWEGEQLDRNCGHCFKCLATQACFWICGDEEPPCFDDPGQVPELARITLTGGYQWPVLDQIRQGAAEAGRHDIAAAIEQVRPR